jgi:hypothetical protein
MLPVLDRIFGTHYLPNAWPERYGIDEPMPDSLAGQFIHPLAPPRPSLAAKDASLHFSRGWRIGVQNQLNLFCDQRVTLIRRGLRC